MPQSVRGIGSCGLRLRRKISTEHVLVGKIGKVLYYLDLTYQQSQNVLVSERHDRRSILLDLIQLDIHVLSVNYAATGYKNSTTIRR